ncbi:DNA repair and recombination protein RadB [Halorubrum vacuolatum]|uniref:DNA repair and recombination protein RadB n=1 Tax=Halorubrum vacuolatum TaxID=63740 RepID=UPI001FE4FCF0|nr:DNA repair and recombination protein RadB [Halorubrum vacuolatum]
MSDPIPTGCPSVDDLLGGGFERGVVTQLYGPPAAGKTNLALAAAVEVAASGGRVLYIDTEGLSIERFRQLAAARVDENRTAGGDDAVGNGEDSIETIAGRLIITEAYDFDDQREAVRDAEELATQVDLIVLDSATGFYRLERADDVEGGDSLRAVTRQVTHLLSLARRYDLAVVITNQVFTDPDADRVRGLGGNTLEHWTGTILRVDRYRGGNRRATLEKHRSKAAGDSAGFRIVEDGLTDGAAP